MAHKKKSVQQKKFAKVMHEFYKNKLHSGSKHGKLVKNVRQAKAIAFSEARHAANKRHHKSRNPYKHI